MGIHIDVAGKGYNFKLVRQSFYEECCENYRIEDIGHHGEVVLL